MKKKNILIILMMIVCTGVLAAGCNRQAKEVTESIGRDLSDDDTMESLPADDQTEETKEDQASEQAVRPIGSQIERLNEDLQQKTNEILEQADDLIEEMKEGN